MCRPRAGEVMCRPSRAGKPCSAKVVVVTCGDRKMASLLSSTITAVSNHLKPHRAEALQRIRLNGLCLITTLIVSYLLPIPSLLTAVRILLTSSHHQRWSTEWIYEWICVFGMRTNPWVDEVKITYWSSFFHRNDNYYHIRVQLPRSHLCTQISTCAPSSNNSFCCYKFKRWRSNFTNTETGFQGFIT